MQGLAYWYIRICMALYCTGKESLGTVKLVPQQTVQLYHIFPKKDFVQLIIEVVKLSCWRRPTPPHWDSIPS